MRLLTIFNHTGDRESFVNGVKSWRATKSLQTELLIVEDRSSTRAVDGVDYVTVDAGSSGVGRMHALRVFLETDATHLFVFDNDLLFKCGFDTTSIDLHVNYGSKYGNCFSSPYRSSMPGHKALELEYGDHIWKYVIPGAAIFMTRAQAAWALSAIPWRIFYRGWDWALSDKCDGVVMPKRSLVQHVGHNDGQNEFEGPDGEGW